LSKIRAGDRLSGPLWIKESTAELCVLELVALQGADLYNLRWSSAFTRISQKYRNLEGLSMDLFSTD
jgi:hypothetical protein